MIENSNIKEISIRDDIDREDLFGNLDFNRIYDAFDKKYAIEES